MVRAFKLYTGPDNASHVLEGTIDEKDRTEVVAIHFKETPAHSSFDWHDDPEPQFVITLSGTLEFTTRDGETFILRPGDVLLAEDHIGSGHKWRLINDQPWRRAYVVLKPGASGDGLAEELRAFVKDRLAPYKYPRWIEFVPELPKTSTGKIQKFVLRDREWAGREKRIGAA